MMDCERAKRYLTALERGELQEAEAQPVRAHLEQCEQCAADLREMQAGTALLHSLGPEEVPEGFAERVVERLPERRGRESWGWGWKVAWGGGTAVLAGGFLVLGLFLGQMEAGKRVALAPQREMASVGAAKEPGFPGGYEEQGPVVTVTPAEGLTAPGEGAQGPFAPEERGVKARRATGFMAEIGAPTPARKGRKERALVIAARPAAVRAREERGVPPVAAQPAVPAPLAAPTPDMAGAAGAALMAKAAPALGAGEMRVAEEEPAGPAAPGVAGAERRFDLRLEGADLVDALRLVASVGGRSLVVGPGVKGTVTVRMRNVTADEALEKLKKEFDLSVEQKDETMVVKRVEESSGVLGDVALG